MPVEFEILSERGLILFTYRGMVGLQESIDVIAASTRHAGYRPWMRHLCDLSGVTGVERDFPKLMQMQARIAEELAPIGDLIVLFYAPTPVGQGMAEMAMKSWDGLNSVIVLVQHTEAEALAILGLAEQSLAALRQLVD